MAVSSGVADGVLGGERPLRVMHATLAAALAAAITAAKGTPFRIADARPVAGGCIHRALALEGAGQRFFAKVNDASQADNLAAEADGLAALARAGMRVPGVVTHGVAGGDAYLVLEFLELRSGSGASYREMGRALARMHSSAVADAFGWPRDNFIGATPQRNTCSTSWVEFWDRERMAPQLELAAANRLSPRLGTLGARLRAALPQLLAGRSVQPSLLHGDLWSGNAAFLATGEPVLFDPAVYHGDPEADLAMTELFGGFPSEFYAGYRDIAPVDAGYAVRKILYNLYHVLNHANLFGGGYAAQAERMMEQLLRQTG